MTLQLPGEPLEDIDLQYKLDTICMAFPVQAQDLAEGVLKLAVTGTARKVAFGTVSLTFTASAQSATNNVSHGLGVSPVVVLFSPNSSGSEFTDCASTARDSSTFTAQAFTTAGTAVSASASFDWIAIG